MIGYSRPLDKEIFRPGPTIFSRHHYRTLNKCGERGSDATLWCGKQKNRIKPQDVVVFMVD